MKTHFGVRLDPDAYPEAHRFSAIGACFPGKAQGDGTLSYDPTEVTCAKCRRRIAEAGLMAYRPHHAALSQADAARLAGARRR